jgi:hypothetical protein
MARLIWRIIHTTFSLLKSKNVIDMFGSWLQGVKWKEKNLILIGVSVVCWSIWLSRNDSVFDKVNTQSCLPALFQGYSLDQILGLTTEAGGAGHYTRSLLSFGDYNNRYFCEEWVTV